MKKKNKKLDDVTKFINDTLNQEYKLDDPKSDCLIF